MARITSRELREKFISPLTRICARLTESADKLQEMEEEDKIPFLPATHKMALDAVINLDDWVGKEIEGKISGAIQGTARFNKALRDEERKSASEEELKPRRKGPRKKKRK